MLDGDVITDGKNAGLIYMSFGWDEPSDPESATIISQEAHT